MSQTAQIYLTEGESRKIAISLPTDITDCHFLHNSDEISAAISSCGGENNSYVGHIIHQDHIFEIKPLDYRFRTLLSDIDQNNLYIVTRRTLKELPEFDTDLQPLSAKFDNYTAQNRGPVLKSGGKTDTLTIETAVFLDPTAYR